MDGTQFHSGLVSQQIKYFANIQNNKCTKDAFDLYADSSTERISLPAFVKAVQKLGSVSKEEDISRLFTAAKVDGKDSLDYDGFCMAVRSRSKLEQWSQMLPLANLLACFMHCADEKISAAPDPLRIICGLDEDAIKVVAARFAEGIRILLSEKITELNENYASLEVDKGPNEAAPKFQTGPSTDSVATASAGSVTDFHNGLTDRVGELVVCACDRLKSPDDFYELRRSEPQPKPRYGIGTLRGKKQ
jgi:hypothetical protein